MTDDAAVPSELLEASNVYFATVWRAYKAGSALGPNEQRLAERMTAHPEWHEWWERADDLGDATVKLDDGTYPFLNVLLEAYAEVLVANNANVRQVYERLRERHSHAQVMDAIAIEVFNRFAGFAATIDAEHTEQKIRRCIRSLARQTPTVAPGA